jgi:anti-sigma regulatory factor (Ser/Thr protein kinase)
VRDHPVASKANLSDIRKRIRADLNRHGIDPSHCFDCLLAVTEVCAKALGRSHADDSEACVWWEVAPDEARFYVEDFSGRESAIIRHPSRSNGDFDLGTELIRNLVDEVNVAVGPSSTTIKLVKRLR